MNTKSRIASRKQLLIVIFLQFVYLQQKKIPHERNTSSVTDPTVLSILMESHEDSRTASSTRTLAAKTLNLSI